MQFNHFSCEQERFRDYSLAERKYRNAHDSRFGYGAFPNLENTRSNQEAEWEDWFMPPKKDYFNQLPERKFNPFESCSTSTATAQIPQTFGNGCGRLQPIGIAPQLSESSNRSIARQEAPSTTAVPDATPVDERLRHKPWITDNILEMIRVRDRLYQKMKSEPTAETIQTYKKTLCCR